MRILSLQPYFGGSHRAFFEGWRRHSIHQWTNLSLPPRHWKWRMRHSAIDFARQLAAKNGQAEFDILFCTDFLNLAEFKGLAPTPIRDLPALVYFHENQFAYPSQKSDPRDLHYGLTNLTSCLAADAIWFNSQFNRQSFFEGLSSTARQWPDFQPHGPIESIRDKTQIQNPGIELPPPRSVPAATGRPIHLVWAARWEHDKNPDDLFLALQQLVSHEIDFQISVIGQSFRRVPDVFQRIRSTFSGHIRRWGFQASRGEYWQALQEADVFVSTANHEFFGMAAAEAIAAGLHPLLPNRLAYPELIDGSRSADRTRWFLYSGDAASLAEQIEATRDRRKQPGYRESLAELQQEVTRRFSWNQRAAQMDAALQKMAPQR